MVSRQIVDRTGPEILVLHVGSNGELQERRGITLIQRGSLPKLLAYRLHLTEFVPRITLSTQ